MKKIIVSFVLIVGFSFTLCATTWAPVEKSCPVCKKTNTYMEIMSYGSYIYSWPSKYQYIYWPLTDDPSIYCCPDCHFATYMWDFDSIPDDKINGVKAILDTIKLDKDYKDYLKILVIKRLEIAEKVYELLERDNEFWCRFYRVFAYHCDDENNPENIKTLRLKALKLAEIMLKDTSNVGKEKENLFIIAAMHNYTGQKDSALIYLKKAASYTYVNKEWKADNSAGLDNYLSDLISQYMDLIRKEEDN